jgi:UrcA family protein
MRFFSLQPEESHMKTLFLACTSMLALTTGVASASASIEETREQAVSYADLDLAKDADAAALMQRIRTAARAVCRAPRVELITLDAFVRAQRCRELATAQAVSRVRAPSLTRLTAQSEAAPHASEAPEMLARHVRAAQDNAAAAQVGFAIRTVARHVRPARK